MTSRPFWPDRIASSPSIMNDIHLAWPALEPGDASKQSILITRLGQVANDAISQRTSPNAVVEVSADQDRWNGIARFHQPTVQLNPGLSRDMDVHDQAGGIANIRAGQK